jgi:UDP-N-acetylglucosamine--N-acetylmuramyl-(pentapeptide) pyrophosphoryl-undecaprenol N-acetylglucosamine transferase
MRLAIAGGGTGGHVVPGLHLLAHLQGSSRLEHLLWFGAGRAAEARSLAALDALAAPAPVERVALSLEPDGGGAPSTLGLCLRTTPCVLRARAALRRARSQALLGLGGYTTLPAVLAARSLGLPIGLLEINAVPGRATRRLATFARGVFHAFPASLPDGGADGHACTGPPLAPSFLDAPAGGEAERAARAAELGFEPGQPLLVVLGGSQGARALNRFVSAELDALLALGAQVLHQVGPGRLAEAATERPGYRAVEYVAPVERALRAATLVLCRGGASTLAELGALCVPAVVVPYPHHRDQHQQRNAQALGHGVLVIDERELGPGTARELARLTSGAGSIQRAAMSCALRGRIPRDAARQILRALEFWCASGAARSTTVASA